MEHFPDGEAVPDLRRCRSLTQDQSGVHHLGAAGERGVGLHGRVGQQYLGAVGVDDVLTRSVDPAQMVPRPLREAQSELAGLTRDIRNQEVVQLFFCTKQIFVIEQITNNKK